MSVFQIREIILLVPIILFALTVHEYAHGWMAERHGDDTARLAGRLTLNPIAHLDPIGTLMLFLVHFGWAKPVPVDPRRLRNPRKDMIWVSLAGPAANLMLALAFGLIIRVYLPSFGSMEGILSAGGIHKGLLSFLILGLEINLALALFNLIPIHPLDGSHILSGLLPLNQAYLYSRLEPYGMMILVGLIIMERVTRIPLFSIILWKPVATLGGMFAGAPFNNLLYLLYQLLQF
ncbi:MAG: site-2 protease family protein [Deltaproteobacteria bacterium]|nr:MAG: site-2 protease family protein [Deltaproteobacteria bacterium]